MSHSFFDVAELFEVLAEGVVICVPGKAAEIGQSRMFFAMN